FGTNKIVSDIAVNPATPSTILVTTGDSPNVIGDVWRSTDGGATWTDVAGGGLDVAFSTSTPSIAYATQFSVIKSTDSGATWTRLPTPTARTYGLAIDPGNPSVVYVGTAEGTVIKTIDGGV